MVENLMILLKFFYFIFLIISTVCTYVLTLTYAKVEILLFIKKELLKVKLYILQNSIFFCFCFILGIEKSHKNKFEINLWHAINFLNHIFCQFQ